MLIPLPLSSFFYVWGCSSDGRALALHARGTGIDTPHLHYTFFFYAELIVPYTVLIYACHYHITHLISEWGCSSNGRAFA